MSELPYRFSFEAFCHIVLYCILLTWFSLCRINGRKDQDNLIRLAGGRSTSFQVGFTALTNIRVFFKGFPYCVVFGHFIQV